jgi:hypothetical protein
MKGILEEEDKKIGLGEEGPASAINVSTASKIKIIDTDEDEDEDDNRSEHCSTSYHRYLYSKWIRQTKTESWHEKFSYNYN